jgi:hypothetical protein
MPSSIPDEDAEVGDVADLAHDDGADGVLLLQQRPGVGLDLLHAEADLLGSGVDAEHDALDHVALVDDLVGVLDALGPAHLGDVDQALDALLELDERAVVDEADDAALDALVDGVADSAPSQGSGRAACSRG